MPAPSAKGQTDQLVTTNLTGCSCLSEVILHVTSLPVVPIQRYPLLRTLEKARRVIAICHGRSAGRRLVKFMNQTQALVDDNSLDQATADDLILCARTIDLCNLDCDTTTGNQPPVALAKSLVLAADAQCQATSTASQFDNGSFDPDGIIVNRSVSPPGPYPLGETLVTYSVVDNGGIVRSVAASVVVEDTTGPTVNFSPNFLVFITPGQSSGTAIFPEPTVTDSCSGVAAVTFEPPSGSIFPIGVNPATLTVIDTTGNTNRLAFNVVVLPNSGSGSNLFPVAIARSVTNAADATCQASVTAEQVDNHSFDADGTIVSRSVQPAGPFAIGSVTPVTLTVVDNQGAASSAAATVTVLDLTPPSIAVLPTDITVTPGPGQSSLVVNYPNLSISDSCSPGSIGVSYSPPSGTEFGVGTNTVTATVFDGAGNTRSITFRVIVKGFDYAACDTVAGLSQRVQAIPLTGKYTGGRRNSMLKKLARAQLNIDLKRLASARYLLDGFILSCSIYSSLDVLDFRTANELIVCATQIKNRLYELP